MKTQVTYSVNRIDGGENLFFHQETFDLSNKDGSKSETKEKRMLASIKSMKDMLNGQYQEKVVYSKGKPGVNIVSRLSVTFENLPQNS